MDFKYPYTDFHELNLDWFLAEFKKLTAEWLQVQHDWADEQQAFQDLHDYVQDYFANLNLYQEVHDVLYSDEMQQTIQLMLSNISASQLPTVVANQIASVVASQLAPVVAAQLPNLLNSMVPSLLPDAVAGEAAAWLADHVDPDTGYVIDDTLTISQAAADAKTVGDELDVIKNTLIQISGVYPSIPTAQNGYYSGNVGSTITFNSANDAKAYQFDLSSYAGSRVIVKFITSNTESTRVTALCNASDVIGTKYPENAMTADGLAFEVTNTYYKLYVSFKSNVDVSTFSVFVESGMCYQNAKHIGSAVFTHGYSDLTDAVNIIDDSLDIVARKLKLPTAEPKYYNGLAGQVISEVADNDSKAYSFDLSGYVGRKVNVIINTTSTVSTRKTALCDSTGLIEVSYRENQFDEEGFWFTIDNTYKYLYVSCTTAAIVSVVIYNPEFLQNENNTAYVSNDGNDGNDGLSRDYPLATIQKAIDLGFKNIFVKEGTYAKFSASNIDDVKIMLDQYYTSFVEQTDVDHPYIIIDGNDIEESGVELTNCNNWTFDSVMVREFTKYGFHITRCDGLVMNDCIAHDIATTGALVGGGFVFVNINGDFKNCGAYNIGRYATDPGVDHNDGFNIHGVGTTNFINCYGYNCQDDGISHHDACEGLIDGGEWHHCGKGGVASPTHGAVIDVRNIYSHDNMFGLYSTATYDYLRSRSPMFYNCVMSNNSNADLYYHNQSNKARLYNCKYTTVAGDTNSNIVIL